MSNFDNFDWIRHPDGRIKRTPNGGYVMINEVGCCYGFNLDKLDGFRKMFDELEVQVRRETNEKRIAKAEKLAGGK